MNEAFLDNRVTLHCGDCLDVLATLEPNSVDSVCCDPPYHLTNNTGSRSPNPGQYTPIGKPKKPRGGFMGKQWDGGGVAFQPDTWRAVLRVLKPGGHLLAFGGTRTYHRMVSAIDDSGFEIRDQIGWAFGSGFPKSHNIQKTILESHQCQLSLNANPAAQRLRRFQVELPEGMIGFAVVSAATQRADGLDQAMVIGVEVDSSDLTDMSLFVSTEHIGWNTILSLNNALDAVCERTNRGITLTELKTIIDLKIFNLLQYQSTLESIVTLNHTALKPAWEPCVLARRPLSEPTVAANVLRWGTGALNIDGCRVEFAGTNDTAAAAAASGFAASRARGTANQSNSIGKESRDGTNSYDPFALKGRWPANLIHDGSDEVVGAFPESESTAGLRGLTGRHDPGQGSEHNRIKEYSNSVRGHTDSGSAARFFYTAKADSDDRLGSKHPTVKPLDLMQYLVRLVTPPRGTVLDCFAGTGTTGEAAFRAGFSAVLIEREPEYQADIRRRMALVLGGPDERRREAIKAKTKDKPVDAGPLFGGTNEEGGGTGERYTATSPIRTHDWPDRTQVVTE